MEDDICDVEGQHPSGQNVPLTLFITTECLVVDIYNIYSRIRYSIDISKLCEGVNGCVCESVGTGSAGLVMVQLVVAGPAPVSRERL